MTQFIPLAEITIPPRQRKEMSRAALDELKESIFRNGLLHAPVLREQDTLVAGERRINAIKELHAENRPFMHDGEYVQAGMVPYVHVNNSSEIAVLEAELEENLMRENLSWQDEVQAKADLHKLRVAQNTEQTFTDTAREIADRTNATSPSNIAAEVSRAMLTSEFLDDPEVKNARNEKLAFNIASRKIRQEFAGLLGGKVPSKHRFIRGDARNELKKLSNSSYSCFILDPPYGVDAEAFGNAAQGRHKYDDSQEEALKLNCELIKACYKLGTPDAHMWLFCDIDMFPALKKYCQSCGWHVNRTPIIWNSGTSGHVPDQRIAIRRNYELVLFAYKGNRGLAYMLDDVISNISSRSTETHGAQKPEKLYELFLKLSALPGDSVLDPCCGSGTIFHAAEGLNLNATGIEKDEMYAGLCQVLLVELGVKQNGS